jgi:nitrous oxide reductase
MEMNDSSRDGAARRTFLKAVAIAGGAVTVVAAGARVVAADAATAQTPAPQQRPAARGYHVTPHIRTYYDKAGF